MSTYKEVFQLAEEKGCEINMVTDGNNCVFVDKNATIKAGDTAFSGDIGFYKVERSDVAYANENHWKVTSEALPEVVVLTLIAKWLRDEHRIFVEFDLDRKDSYCFRIMHYTTVKADLYFGDTYEDAYLNGVNYALKLI